ncbi:MAG: FAD-dependent oxidoreductase [Pseudomonadota bacterium]
MTERIAIIGAGMAGCTAARMLQDKDRDVFILEKSKGTGGRLATRRNDLGDFDHGVQYVNAKSKEFRGLMTGLSNQGSCAFWKPDGKDRDSEWHVGLPGMSGLVKPMIEDITVHKGTTVSKIELTDGGVRLHFDEGRDFAADRVLITAPVPQANKLAGDLDDAFAPLADVSYLPCWTLMLAFDEATDLPEMWRGDMDDVVSWYAAQHSRRDDDDGAHRYVFHAGSKWSAEHIEDEKADVSEAMIADLREAHGLSVEPMHSAIHRWRYAYVDKPYGEPFVSGADDRIVIAGDGMLGPRVEAAFESGTAAAKHLLSL